jgi:hypothetical protein
MNFSILGIKNIAMRYVSLFCLIVFLYSCSPSTKPTTTAGNGKHAEDLSGLRKIEVASDTGKTTTVGSKPGETKRDPSIYLEAKHSVNQTLDAVLDSIDRVNKQIGMVDGFTIQLYSGVQRDEALNAKKQISTAMPELDSDLQFVQPNFRVRVGKYFTRMDAEKDFIAVRRFFPNAIVLPERISIK